MNQKFIADHYGPKTATTYDNTIIKFLGYQEGLEAMAIEAVFALKKIDIPKVKILDLGCGTGNGILTLLKLIKTYEAIFPLPEIEIHLYDQSEYMLSRALEKITNDFKETPKVTLGKIEELELNEKFHIILSSYVLHHFEDEALKDILQNIADRLKPDGAFLLADRYLEADSQDEDMNIDAMTGSLIKYYPENFDTLKQHLIQQMKDDGDVPCTSQEMLKLLRDLGLAVRLPYKQFTMSLISARKGRVSSSLTKTIQ